MLVKVICSERNKMAKFHFTLAVYIYIFIINYNCATFIKDFNIKTQKLKGLNLSACKTLVLHRSFNWQENLRDILIFPHGSYFLNGLLVVIISEIKPELGDNKKNNLCSVNA